MLNVLDCAILRRPVPLAVTFVQSSQLPVPVNSSVPFVTATDPADSIAFVNTTAPVPLISNPAAPVNRTALFVMTASCAVRRNTPPGKSLSTVPPVMSVIEPNATACPCR